MNAHLAWPLLIAGVFAASFASPARAQAPESAIGPQTLQPGVEVRMRGSRAVDDQSGPSLAEESAIRYFASQGERARVEAEIEKLQARYPGWRPPEDLYGTADPVDERPLWALYEEGAIGSARELIAELEEQHPDWSPPDELVDLLDEKEVRADLVDLERAERWQELVETAEANPAQVGCRRIDNAWRLARAHAALDQPEQAFAVYAGLIEDCQDVDHRIATLQKARARLDRGRFERLLDREALRPKSRAEAKRFEDLRIEPGPDPAIQALFGPNPTIITARKAADPVRATQNADGAEAIGWIYLNAGNLDQAEAWFKRAYTWGATASRAEGLARALGRQGRLHAVEELEQAWPEALAGLAREARTSRLTRAFLDRDTGEVLELSRSLDDDPVAQSFRGWTLLDLERPTEAEAAFGRVLKIATASLEQRREAVYGLARSALRIGNVNRAEGLVRIHDLLPEQRHELLAEIMAHKANEAFQAEDFRTALEMFETRRHYAEPSRGLMIQEAWARYHLGQKYAAARIFTRLDRIQSTPATRAGIDQLARYIDGYAF